MAAPACAVTRRPTRASELGRSVGGARPYHNEARPARAKMTFGTEFPTILWNRAADEIEALGLRREVQFPLFAARSEALVPRFVKPAVWEV